MKSRASASHAEAAAGSPRSSSTSAIIVWSAMQPWSAGRVYGNVLGPDESGRLREAYGENYGRLAHVKSVYDPANLFSVNQNIKPAAQANTQP